MSNKRLTESGRHDCSQTGNSLIFLISLPRSGSTMLQRILGANSDVHTLAEPWIMLHPIYALKKAGISAEYDAGLARQGLDDFLQQLPNGIEDYYQAIRNMSGSLYAAALANTGKRYFLDKTPRYYNIIPELRKTFPDAKFIILLRNPCAALSSVLKTWFGGSLETLKKTANYLDIVNGPRLLAEGIKSLGDKALVVHYEDLVQDPEQTIRDLCNNLNLRFDSAMLQYGSQPRPAGRFGDPHRVNQHDTVVRDYADQWSMNLVEMGLLDYTREYLTHLGNDVLSTLGYSAAEINSSLQQSWQAFSRPDQSKSNGNISATPNSVTTLPGIAIFQSEELTEQGETLFLQGDYDTARERFAKAIAVNRSCADAYNNLAVLCWNEGDLEGARKNFSDAININPAARSTISNYGEFLLKDKAYDEAISLYTNYLQNGIDDSDVQEKLDYLLYQGQAERQNVPWIEYNYQASCKQAEGDLQDALTLFRQASDLASQNTYVHKNLSDLYIEMGDHDQAFQEILDAYKLNRYDVAIVIRIVQLLIDRQRFDDALDICLLFKEKHPRQKDIEALMEHIDSSRMHQDQPLDSSTYKMSAIVSTYASEAFIAECLDDLLGQTVADKIEVVIVDADSPENERAVVEAYQKKHSNIKYIRTPERIGIYEAWNIAIRNASGQYIISCSTNDRLHPEACENLMKILDQDQEVAIVYGNAYLTPKAHETFEENSVYDTYVWPEYDFHELLKRPMVGPHPMWRKSLHTELGYFDESYKAIGDQDFWLRVGEKHKLKRITKFTTLHWITEDSLSGDQSVSITELKRAQGKYFERELYRQWLNGHSMEEIDAQLMAERMHYMWKSQPSITFVMYVFDGQQEQLHNTLESLETSFYTGWNLKVISELSRPEILNTNKGSIEWCQVLNDKELESARNAVSNMHTDGWLAVMPPGIEVEAHFLNTVVDNINEDPHVNFIYTDHDHIEQDGRYQDPWLKPDFNYDYLLSKDYLGPLCLIKSAVLQQIGGLSQCFALEHYDMLLRLLEKYDESSVLHIDNILYHVPDSLYVMDVHQQRKQLVKDYLRRRDIAANVVDGYKHNTCRIEYLHDTRPLVSIIIPTKDKYELISACLASLLERTRYTNYEVLVIDNQTTDVDALNYLQKIHSATGNRVRVLKYPKTFNYAAISNMAAAQASGDYLLFLNNDTKVIQDNWLDRMMSHAMREDVAVVGARLAYPETSEIQHAGVIIGMDGLAGHPYLANANIKDAGYMDRLQVDQNYSAVTGACLLVKNEVYHDVGGMDEENLKVSYNDIDLCLKIREKGLRIVWTPYATLLHHGNVSQHVRLQEMKEEHEEGFMNECDYMFSKWLPKIANDPAYNRHLSLVQNNYRIENGVIINWDRKFSDRDKIIAMPLYGGSGEYRIRGPLRQLARAGLAQTEWTHGYQLNEQRVMGLVELARSGADTVISHAGIANNMLKNLEDYRKYLDVFTVFTLDDLITDVPEGNNFRKKIPSEPRKRLRKALGFCDRLVVTTEPLAELCRNMIDDIEVIPNCLEDDIWSPLASRRRQGRKPRVGWAGAQQHADDLAFIIDVVKETADEVEWVFFGMCPKEIRPYITEEHEFVLSFNHYAEKLASLDLDLSIAPLAQHPFNEAKSNLRLLEYGIFGWPVISTDIYPYQNAPVKRVQNRKEAWVEAIRERIYDLDAAYAEGDALRQWVQQNFMLSQHIDVWAKSLNIKDISTHSHLAKIATK